MELEKLFQALQKNIQEEERNSKIITPDFNVFEILSPKETQLSKFIGELLKPEGVHAQGKLFLNQFIDSFLRKKTFFKNAKNVDVSLEYSSKSLDGRIDIFILFDNKFAIAIENKPFTDDQEAQIMRYCDFMAKEYGEDKYLMIYLEAQGEYPTEKSLSKDERAKLEKENKFSVISYSQLRDWINNCIEILKEAGAKRLTKLLGEFAEYINLEFRKQNELKNTPMRKIIKENILDAHRLVSLWNDSYKDFKKLYAEKVNQLFNEELPKLVYEDLKSKGVINDNWEYKKGDFDIKVKHVKGFSFKKKTWKNSEIGVYSNKTGYGKLKGVNNNMKASSSRINGIKDRNIANYFSRGFFPLILSNTPIRRPNYNEDYCNLTGCKIEFKEYTLKSPMAQWFANFPENNYQQWGDEHWLGIKPNGKTVEYISSFLEKLIKACETDIDDVEGVREEDSLYTESRFGNFVNQFSWIYAKTYANKAPHEYIVLSKVGNEHKEEFIKIAQFIRDNGFKAYYYSRVGYYYRIDENYYWTMDEKIEDTDLINRAKWNDYELINNQWTWKGMKTGANRVDGSAHN